MKKEKKTRYTTDSITSKRMSLIKSQGSNLEITFAKLLRFNKVKYRSQPKLYGKPDFRILDTNILIFCDSAFWHGRRKHEINGSAFSRNQKLWVEKLVKNKKRDSIVNKELGKQGWQVLRFWDDDINKRPEEIIKVLKGIQLNGK